MDMRRFFANTSILFLLAAAFGTSSYAKAENSHRQIVDQAWQIINRNLLVQILTVKIGCKRDERFCLKTIQPSKQPMTVFVPC
jgi:hypothetical protein